jgi:two-component system, OmpR family, sensor kinase
MEVTTDPPAGSREQGRLAKPPWGEAAFPWFVLVVLLLSTALVAMFLARNAEALARARLESAAEEKQGRIVARVDAYVALLMSGTSFLGAEASRPREVSRDDFRRYVARLDIAERYPGLLGIGFATLLEPGTEAAIERRAHAEGEATFRVWPEQPAGAEMRTTILYLEPQHERNKAALGYDMATNPVRLAAMARARDTGEPALSGTVTLVQEIDEHKQPGFLIYVPLYDGDEEPATVEERRARLRGFVYGPLRAGDMFRSAAFPAGEMLEYQVYEGEAVDRGRLLYDAKPGLMRRLEQRSDMIETVRRLEIAGHAWTLRFVGTSGVADAGWPTWFAVSGTLMSFVVFGFLIAQARARRALHDEKVRAEEAAELRERLLAIVGHDLRNPLGAIIMAAETMLRRDELSTRDRASAQRIVDSAARVGRMIGQLLDYARLRQGRELSMSFQPSDVHAACRHAIDELRILAPEEKIELEVRGDGRGVWDSDRVAEVVSNLVGNAIQHGHGPVQVKVDEADAGVAIDVHNVGPPIPPELVPRLFRPFGGPPSATPAPKPTSGAGTSLGLGLYIVRQIVHAHGGRIDVRSPDRDGTTFSVWLPRQPPAAPEQHA